MTGARSADGGLGLPGASLVLVALVLGAFAPALHGGFLVLDDEPNFVWNEAYRGFSARHLAWAFTTEHMGHYQPLTWLSFALDHALSGLDGARFHQASVLWHVLTALAFWLVAERLLAPRPGAGAEARPPTRPRMAALLAALVFAVHPLRAESVAWITGRNDVLAGLFALLAVLAWLRYAQAVDGPPLARASAASALLALLAVPVLWLALELRPGSPLAVTEPALALGAGALLALATLLAARAAGGTQPGGPAARQAYLCACAALGLSLLSKASGLMLPAVLIVLDILPTGRFARARARLGAGRAWLALLAEKAPFFALSCLAARLAAWAKAGGDLRSLGEHGVGERLAQAAYGLAFYPLKTLWPSGLSPMVDLPAELALREPRFLVPAVLVVALSTGLLAWRRRAPAGLATWSAFVLLIFPVLGLAQAGAQLVADRYSYLACLPFALGAGGLWLAAVERGERQARWASGAAIAGVLALAGATWTAAARWADPVRLFEHGIAASGSPRLMTNLALTLNAAAQREPAARAALLAEALAWSERAVRTAESQRLALPAYRLHRGTILYNLRRPEEALVDLAWFTEREPGIVSGHLNLALALNESGRAELAAASFRRALELAPMLAPAWRGLGLSAEVLGRRDEALASYRRALALAPDPTLEARVRALEGR